MTFPFRIAGFVAIVCSFAANATAHPGHGEPGAAHYLTDPRHLLTVVMSILGAALCSRLVLGNRRQKQA